MNHDINGTAIRKARLAAGMTQDGLARATGMTRSHVAQVEGGRCSLSAEKMCRVAQVLRMTLSEILDESRYEERG